MDNNHKQEEKKIIKRLNTAGFCVIIILAIAIQPIFAQDDAMQFGMKVGLNLANFSFDVDDPPFYDTGSAVKFGAGGIMLYPLSEILSLQVELMYLLKGAELVEVLDGSDGFKTDAKWNLAYLSVPVLGRYNLGSGDSSPYFVAGPEIGFLLSAELEIVDRNVTEDVKNSFKSIDIGFNIGAGAPMNIGATPMFGEVRYSMGLSNIDDEPEDPGDSIKTSGIQVFVGMMF